MSNDKYSALNILADAIKHKDDYYRRTGGTDKFTVKSRPAKGWPGCVEYVVLDAGQKEHGPFNTRAQANAHVAKILGVSLKEALNQDIED